jgi:hypothetical protein
MSLCPKCGDVPLRRFMEYSECWECFYVEKRVPGTRRQFVPVASQWPEEPKPAYSLKESKRSQPELEIRQRQLGAAKLQRQQARRAKALTRQADRAWLRADTVRA